MTGRITNEYRNIRVDGIKVGQVQDVDAKTGVTVILFDKPAHASINLCGKATSTRQVDALLPDHMVDEVNAILLTGGSAFGLDATGGVLKYLEDHDCGLQTKYGRVPICPTAAIFDLGFGDFSIRPNSEMAYEACEIAESERMAVGSVGAGCGASVGKLGGIDNAMKGGVGTRSYIEDELSVQAIAVCNGFGDVVDSESGDIIAGARSDATSLEFIDIMKVIESGEVPKGFVKPKVENTVLIAVITNARLTKQECFDLAKASEEGLSRSMRPAMAPFDGDVIFFASCGDVNWDKEKLGEISADCVAGSIESAIRNADGFGILPSYAERLELLDNNESFSPVRENRKIIDSE